MNILYLEDFSLEKEIPDYIKSPRKWINNSYKPIDEKYVGISFNYIYPHSNITNNIFWVSNQSLIKIYSMNVEHIYEKYSSSLYKLITKKDLESLNKKKCIDCCGSGNYIGFMIIEKCKKCSGSGYI